MVMKAIPFKRMYNTIRIDEKQSSEKTEMLAYQFRNFENLRHFEKISWFEFYHFELFWYLLQQQLNDFCQMRMKTLAFRQCTRDKPRLKRWMSDYLLSYLKFSIVVPMINTYKNNLFQNSNSSLLVMNDKNDFYIVRFLNCCIQNTFRICIYPEELVTFKTF